MTTDRMLQFVDKAQQTPGKRDIGQRVEDFREIYDEFSIDGARAQASRCSQCGVLFCQIHCPLHNNIPDWLMLAAEGRLEEAYEVSSATNNFPEICGRICPQDRLCEGNCVIEKGFQSVTIGAVERFVTETAFENGWVRPIPVGPARDQSVGIIGGGPGGLAAAEQLRRAGYAVTVYDRYDRMGGLLIYGIPGFKLEKEVVERRIARLQEAGIEMRSNFEVGRDASLEELRQRHDAVLIATGVYKAREIKAPGITQGGIYPALDYLITSNRQGLGDAVPAYDDGTLNAAGKRVVVIGGGDTAMDCVRTAVRQGAKSVKCLYRRDRANMPGSLREVANAEEEGVEFVWLTAPEAFIDGDDGQVRAVKCSAIHLGVADATGRQTPRKVAGSERDIDADMVIMALGFDPEELPVLFAAPELAVSRWGTVLVDPRTSMSNLDGVFAAGDIVRGASLVVWAIQDGRNAAEHIHKYIQQQVAANAPLAAAS